MTNSTNAMVSLYTFDITQSHRMKAWLGEAPVTFQDLQDFYIFKPGNGNIYYLSQGQCVDRKLGFLCKCKLQKLPHTMQRKHKLGASTLCCEQNKGLELSTPTRADYFIPAVNNGGD